MANKLRATHGIRAKKNTTLKSESSLVWLQEGTLIVLWNGTKPQDDHAGQPTSLPPRWLPHPPPDVSSSPTPFPVSVRWSGLGETEWYGVLRRRMPKNVQVNVPKQPINRLINEQRIGLINQSIYHTVLSEAQHGIFCVVWNYAQSE